MLDETSSLIDLNWSRGRCHINTTCEITLKDGEHSDGKRPDSKKGML